MDVPKFVKFVRKMRQGSMKETLNSGYTHLSFGFILWRIVVDFEANFINFGTFNSWKPYGRAKICKICSKDATRIHERNPKLRLYSPEFWVYFMENCCRFRGKFYKFWHV